MIHVYFTFGALAAFKSLTLLPWATILSLILLTSAPPDGAAAGGVTPGFHSLPVTLLYSAFRTKSTFTASSISAYNSKRRIALSS